MIGQGDRRDDATAPGGDDLQHAMRELSAELRAQQEELEEAAEHIERANRSLPEVALEFLYRGDIIRVAVGQRSWIGVVTHVGIGVMTLRTQAGAEIDVAYEGLSSIRVVERTTSGGRTRTTKHPGELVARLREVENSGEAVELGGRDLVSSLEGTVEVVASSHLEFRARDGSEWVVPLGEVGYLIRSPGRPLR